MFQDISPHKYDCTYAPRNAKSNDYIFFMKDGKVGLKKRNDTFDLFTLGEYLDGTPAASAPELAYLFSIDETAFFLLHQWEESMEIAVHFEDPRTMRRQMSGYRSFAGVTALHLAEWYAKRRYCPRCSAPMEHKSDERAMVCKTCGNIEFPQIAPVVIVGVTKGDEILLTRYAKGASTVYKKHALVAGFVEIGESVEDAVRREVMEEVSLKLKNIRYYKSQPWGFTGTVLMGFFADADGEDSICVDGEELCEAEWFKRENIPHDDNTYSLTWDMIETFRLGKEPK